MDDPDYRSHPFLTDIFFFPKNRTVGGALILWDGDPGYGSGDRGRKTTCAIDGEQQLTGLEVKKNGFPVRKQAEKSVYTP